MSGRNPASFGILGPIGGESTQLMPEDIPNPATLPKSQGYATAIAGKWHLNLNIAQGTKHDGFAIRFFLHGQKDLHLRHSHVTEFDDTPSCDELVLGLRQVRLHTRCLRLRGRESHRAKGGQRCREQSYK